MFITGKPFIYQTETTEPGSEVLLHLDNQQENKAFFAFELVAISLSKQNKYVKWAIDILQTLKHNNSDIKLYQLMFQKDNKKIGVYYIFEIQSEQKDEIQGIYDELLAHLKLFFLEKSYYQPAQQPVYFRPLDKRDELVNVLQKIDFKQYKSRCHITPPVRRFQNTKIKGYHNGRATSGEILVPAVLPLNNRNVDLLFHLMSRNKNNTLLQIIRKKTLNNDQLLSLKSVKRAAAHNPFDKKYITAAGLFSENKDNLFEIDTYLLSGKKNQVNLLNEISEIYYDDRAVFTPVDKLVEHQETDFTCVYDYNLARTVFKVPAITRENIYASYRLLLKYETDISPYFFNADGVLIGKHLFGKVYLDPKQFKKHTYLIGKTGTGKTSIIYSMILDLINKGRGVALIDPHGDIFEIVRQNIPDDRKDDVIIFDPADLNNDFGFSILNFDRNFPEQQSFIVGELIKIFDDMYDLKIVGGPMFETYFKMAAYLVMNTVDKPVLQDIDRFYRDYAFRTSLLEKCKTPRINDFFKSALKTSGDQSFENFGPYITSKLTRFTDNYYLSKVLNQREKSFDFRKMIDGNKIFLVKLNKGKLGSNGVTFMGNILFNKIIMAAYSRSNIKERERKPFSMFVDEFQNFTSADITTALAETRKYNLHLILSNQNMAQISEKTTRNILSNVGAIISAAVSPFDAGILESFFSPFFQKKDLILMDNFKFIVKTSYDNKNVKPFIVETMPYD